MVGLLNVLESTLHKLQPLPDTMSLCVDTLDLVATVLPSHVSDLIECQMYEEIETAVTALIGVCKHMKECKVGLVIGGLCYNL